MQEPCCLCCSRAPRTVSVSIDWSDPTGTTVCIESSVKKSKTAMGVRSRLLLPLLAPCVWFEVRGSRTGSRPGRTWGSAIQERFPLGALCLPSMRPGNPLGSPWRRKTSQPGLSREISRTTVLRLQALAGRRPPGFRWKLAGCLPITCTTVPAAQRRTAETFSLPLPRSLRKCCWP